MRKPSPADLTGVIESTACIQAGSSAATPGGGRVRH